MSEDIKKELEKQEGIIDDAEAENASGGQWVNGYGWKVVEKPSDPQSENHKDR